MSLYLSSVVFLRIGFPALAEVLFGNGPVSRIHAHKSLVGNNS
jgi:hypothetical protein